MTTTPADEMRALAARCEAAKGANYDLEHQIAHLTGYLWADITARIPPFTASLDAAMTLATGFVLLHLSDIGADGLPLCRLGDPSTTPVGEWTGIASRLELAICAAALRARATLMENTGE